MTHVSHLIRDLETGQYIEAHISELPFHEKRIVMRVHESKEAFINDLKNDPIH